MTAAGRGKGIDSSSQDARSRVTLAGASDSCGIRRSARAEVGTYVLVLSLGLRVGAVGARHACAMACLRVYMLLNYRMLRSLSGHSEYVPKDAETTCIYTGFVMHTAQHQFRVGG